MKNTITLLISCFIGAFSVCNGQTNSNKKELKKQDTVKSMNLLDEQTKILGQMFELGGMSEEENIFGGVTNYREVIEKMEASEEVKQHLREIYDLYDTSLDPTKKAELEIKAAKMLEDAMAKAQSEQ